jgi:hypothetical protein
MPEMAVISRMREVLFSVDRNANNLWLMVARSSEKLSCVRRLHQIIQSRIQSRYIQINRLSAARYRPKVSLSN